MQCLPIQINTGYVDDPLPNIAHMLFRMPACIVWLYYAPRSTLWWFPDHFSYLVCGLIGKKNSQSPTSTTDIKVTAAFTSVLKLTLGCFH
jgi:hypothetical protein